MRTRPVMIYFGCLAAILLIAVVASVQNDDVLGARHSGPRAHVATAATDGRTQARLAVVSGATTLTVRAADLGGELFRASTPVTSGAVPAVVVSGDQVQIQLTDVGRPDGVPGGPSALEVLVSDQVRWSLRLDGGATETAVDMSHGRLAALDFGAGSARIEAALPRPDGTVTVRMTGGASAYNLHLPDGVPARVRSGGGASSVTVDGVTRSGIAGGDTWDAPGWASASDRYDVENTAGVSTFTLDRA